MIASRGLDPSMVAWVLCYPTQTKEQALRLEKYLYHKHNDDIALLNVQVPKRLNEALGFDVPEPIKIDFMSPETLAICKDPLWLMSQQAIRCNEIATYIRDVKENKDTKRLLRVSVDILSDYTKRYVNSK
jgi:hypothetical protein